jgi:hypothetical protein
MYVYMSMSRYRAALKRDHLLVVGPVCGAEGHYCEVNLQVLTTISAVAAPIHQCAL